MTKRCPNCGFTTQNLKYNLCDRCYQSELAHNESAWKDLENKVADSFTNPSNKQKFLGMELELRRGVILQMIQENIITYPEKFATLR